MDKLVHRVTDPAYANSMPPADQVRFPVEAVIYKDAFTPMLSVSLGGLGNIGFMVGDVPRERWDWLLYCISTQTSDLVEKAYSQGRKAAQQEMRKALGI